MTTAQLPPPDTAASIALREIVELARQHGLDTGRALRAAGIAPDTLADVGAYVPVADFERMLIALIDDNRDPALPLRMGSQAQPSTFGIVSFIAMVAPTIADVIERAVTFERLLGDFASTRVEPCGDDRLMVWDCRLPDPRARRCMTEGVLAAWAAYARWLLDDPDVAPLETWFAHAPPAAAHLPAYAQAFRSPVLFNQPLSGLRVPAAFLARRLRQPDPVLFRTLDAHARERLAGGGTAGSVVAAVADAIGACIEDEGVPRKESVAARVGMNPRTLLRRLADEGTTYQDVLDDARRVRALQLVRDPTLTQGEVAARLGFTENRSLQRCFRRWTGMTFGEYRARHTGPGADGSPTPRPPGSG